MEMTSKERREELENEINVRNWVRDAFSACDDGKWGENWSVGYNEI